MADPFSASFWAENNDLDDVDLDGVEGLDHPPICAACGVTMLPADAFGTGFSCQNDDCDSAADH